MHAQLYDILSDTKAPSVIIAGADQIGVQLYQVDPRGTFFRGAGFAIGRSSETAQYNKARI
jgi:20S proteasome alpha/beta subunit